MLFDGPEAAGRRGGQAPLRAAGAVIIGKTSVPELMTFRFTESETFGATRNPWDTALSPGGSSGGNGAAVAAGLAPLALGSDGGGSIRIPSGWCGLSGSSRSATGPAGAARGRLVRAECQRSDRAVGGRRRAVPGRDDHDAWSRRWFRRRRGRTPADCELR